MTTTRNPRTAKCTRKNSSGSSRTIRGWVETDGEEGKRADLSQTNLQGARLAYANLQGANLAFADLQGAVLADVNFREAFLRNTTFERLIATRGGEPTTDLEAADLAGADFRDADLSDAKLSDVTGLLAGKLAGTDLSNAKLPEDIAKFQALDHVAEISKHARNNFLAVLGACVFSWLTIATTTDVALLINRAETWLFRPVPQHDRQGQ